MPTYRPFSTTRRAQLDTLLRIEPLSLERFRTLRTQLSGEPSELAGLRALVEQEPGLASLLEERVLPSIVRHARTLLRAHLPVLELQEAGQAARTTATRADVAGWLAHLFLGTLPQPAAEHPQLDFAPLLNTRWPQELAKLRCVLTYFDRTAEAPPPGRIEVERVVTAARTAAEWAGDSSALGPLTVLATGAIEDALGCRQVDFANRYLGGGVLSGGCVQEEIRFVVSPELLFGLIVSPRMGEAEAIVLRGAEQFAQTRGYARSLQYAGPFADPCRRDDDGTPEVELVAIDAVDYRRHDPQAQFAPAILLRELGKARSGFLRDARALPVATGNWGCGVFGGDPALKAVLQWLAASAEGRALRYYSFGNPRVGDLAALAAMAQQRVGTVGALFQRLLTVCEQGGTKLYERLLP